MSTKNNLNIDKFTTYLSNIPSRIAKAHPLKKAYGALWVITGILLIVAIGLLIAYGANIGEVVVEDAAGKKTAVTNNLSSSGELNAVAAIVVLFVISLIAAFTTTVFASVKFKKTGTKTDKKKVGK